jgi:hypothetical protein
VDYTTSVLTGYVDSFPKLRNEGLFGKTVVRSGGVCLVCALRRDIAESEESWLWKLGGKNNRSDSLVQIWVRVHKIGGAMHEGPAGREAGPDCGGPKNEYLPPIWQGKGVKP